MKKVMMLDMSKQIFKTFDTLEEAIAVATETSQIRMIGGNRKEFNPKHPDYRQEA